MSPQTYSETSYTSAVEFLSEKWRILVVDCFGKIPVLDTQSISDCTCKINLAVPLLSVSSPIFLTWIPIKHLRGSFFCRNSQWVSAASYSQGKAPSQIFDSFLNAFFNSVVMLLYHQYCYSCSFIYFVILSFVLSYSL